MVKKEKSTVDKFITDLVKIEPNLNDYIIGVDEGKIRVEIKDLKGNILYYMEYDQTSKTISSNIANDKLFKLFKTFLKQYYNLKRI